MADVRIESAAGVRRVTLARPAKRNALTIAMIDELLRTFADPPSNSERVVVLAAEGKAFCAGMDLEERLKRGPWVGENPINRLCELIQHYPLPVVAVVEGDAIAGGTELALHCDIVVAVDTAKFGMPLVQIGTVPPWPLVRRVFDTCGPVVGAELLLLGDHVSAGRLAALGIIAMAVAPAEFAGVAERVVARLATNAPLAVQAVKAGLNRLTDTRSRLEHADIEEMLRRAAQSADAEEGMRARLERRPAQFRGV